MKRLIKKQAEFDYWEIQQGDYVDFGSYGNLYVCNPNYDERSFWVTDREEDRNNRNARGWSIRKTYAKEIIESYESNYEDGDYEEDEDFSPYNY